MKKIINFLDKFDFGIEYIFSILFCISLIKILVGEKSYFVLLTISFIIILLAILNIFRKKEKIEKIFLKIMIPIGLMYLFLILPNRVPDENDHIYRAYNISNFKLIAAKNEKGEAITMIPKFLLENNRFVVNNYKDLENVLLQNTDYSDTIHTFNSAQAYFPTQYIFSAISFFVVRNLGINIFIGIYLARLLNFTFFLIAAYLAIKMLPFGKILFVVYMFSPIFLQQIISVSADSLINSAVILYISLIISLLFTQDKLNKSQKVLLIGLTLFLALAKYVYFPIILINVLLLFKKEFNKKDKVLMIILSIVSIVLACGNYYISTLYTDTRERMMTYNVNSKEQIKYLLSNKQNLLPLLKNTLKIETPRWIREFFGASLDWLTLSISKKIYVTYAILLIFTIFVEQKEINYRFNFKQSIYNIMLVAGISGLILLGLYMTWSFVGEVIIDGVQGRYFIPIAILFLLSIKNYKISLKNKYMNAIIPLLIVIINSGALYEIVKFYM